MVQGDVPMSLTTLLAEHAFSQPLGMQVDDDLSRKEYVHRLNP